MLKLLNIILFIIVIALTALTISLYAPFENENEIPNQIPLFGMDGLSHTDLKEDIFLINIFTSWCSSCKAEKKHLMTLHKNFNLPVYGVVLKDKKEDVLKILKETGTPYSQIGYDESGIFAQAIGTSGVPASIIATADFQIQWRWLGPIDETVIENEIAPLLEKLRAEN